MDSTPAKPKRRSFPASERARILHEYDTAPSAVARAALMRREGVYSSQISTWRRQLLPDAPLPKRGRIAQPEQAEIQRLLRENQRLQKRAEKAESLVDVMGKVCELLQTAAGKSGDHEQP